ncbi:MAG: MerR family transcriptional regulator [Nocardioides sp.]|uniref:MerR family transcriptional regulator n=1 Tax=Nocardioides sp. TaxID=35761 RepID=UPI0039E596BE
MRISELAAATGTPVATLKFYLREGLLPKGEATAATQATYGQAHVDRVRLIAALSSVRELPLAKVREILAVVDQPPSDVVHATGQAVASLPPYPEPQDPTLARARNVIEELGLGFEPDYPATAQLQAALDALDSAGLPWTPEIARRYLDPLIEIGRDELAPMQQMGATSEAVTYAVLGTALYEPLILALRRLVHHHLLTQRRQPR